MFTVQLNLHIYFFYKMLKKSLVHILSKNLNEEGYQLVLDT